MKKKNLFLLCLAIVLSSNLISAQTGEISRMSKLNLHIEGTTLLFVNSISINLERKLFSSNTEKIHLYGRVGYGYVEVYKIFSSDQRASGGLLALTMLTGKGSHHFEASGGAFLGSYKSINDGSPDDGFQAFPLIDVGYRFQEPGEVFIFRAKVGTSGLGVGIGYAF